LSSIYLINKYNVETEFPKLKKVIEYYEKSSLLFVVIEGLICFSILLCRTYFCLIEVGYPIFKH